MELLDCTRIDKKLWLVKVPTSVAQLWRPLCTAAMSSTSIGEDDGAVELGTIKSQAPLQGGAQGGPPGGTQGKEMLLSLKGAETRGLPSQYRMNPIPNSGILTTVVSYKAELEGEEPSQIRVDGTVERSFNLMPIHKVDENGQIEIDAAYRTLSKARSIQAAIKAHPVKVYEDTRENRVATFAHTKAVLDQKRRAEAQRQVRLDNKRLRKDKPELEAELFRLFERQSHWAFPQLQRETNQPAQYLKEVLGQVRRGGGGIDQQYLKEVLGQISFQNKRGPNKDLYEIKHEYKEGGKEAAA